MLFDIRQFENYFKERILRKGLRIFQSGAVELMEKQNGFEFHFAISDHTLILKKKGDKLLSYACNCGEIFFCEHLSAAMFYFQQETLGIKINKGRLTKAKKEFDYSAVRKKEIKDLELFIKSSRNDLSSASITNFLVGRTAVLLSDVYAAQIKHVFEPYLATQPNVIGLKELEGELEVLIRKIKKGFKKKEDVFYLQAGIVKAFLFLSPFRPEDRENYLKEIYSKALQALEVRFVKGLSNPEKLEWFNLTLASIESNKILQGETFTFLLPRFLSFATTKSELRAIRSLLEKRHYKRSYSQTFDKFLIAKLQAAEKERQLFKVALPPELAGREPEFTIARAELFFCAGQVDKGFKVLEAQYEFVKENRKNQLSDYLDYIVLGAKTYQRSEIEMNYLRQGFIHRLFIVLEELERFLSLIPKEKQEESIQQLLKEIRNTARGYFQDKIAVLLLRGNMLDELVRELERQHNKFGLMHEIALRKFPEYTPGFLNLYIRHLSESLKQNPVYNFQLQTFAKAKTYFDKLPISVVNGLIKKILDQVGKAGHFYRYVNELYDYPFLKEEHNY